MTELAQKKCIPCQGGVPPLAEEDSKKFLSQLQSWELVENHHLKKTYEFPKFTAGIAFVNKVADLAEEENHHPEMQVGFRQVTLTIWTHKIDGLTESDFIFAAKCDQL